MEFTSYHMDPRIQELLKDASRLARLAISEPDIRNAAEKAWGAAVQASKALCLGILNQYPDTTRALTRLMNLMMARIRDPELAEIRRRYGNYMSSLHADCFYNGEIQPEEFYRELIREVYLEFIPSISRKLGIQL